MSARRFTAPLACLTLMIAASPALARQDHAWQGFAAADAMNTLHHNLLNRTNEAAQERRDRAAGRRPAARPAPPTSLPANQLTFRRDPAVTRSVQADLVQRVSKRDAVAGRALSQDLARQDPITVATPVFRRFGLDTGNVVDATAIYFMGMWGVANNVEAQMSPAQARGARAHVARTVNFAGMGLNTPAARQRYADSLVYQALLMDAAIERAQNQKDTAQQRALADAAHGHMVSLGLDMRKLAITDQGFVSR
jgi:hypothetical protein